MVACHCLYREREGGMVACHCLYRERERDGSIPLSVQGEREGW